MELRISSQMARMGLNITRPSMNLTNSLPQIELELTPSRLEISSPSPRIEIDQSQCFADEDHRNVADFMQYWTDYSRSQMTQGIDRIVSDGNNLAAIQTGFSIADLGAEAVDDQKEFEIIAVPSQPPRIDWEIQPVSYQFTPGTVQITANPGQINNQFQWGKVEAYVAQPSSLDIQWIDDRQVDIKA
ncbi:MAG TPA: DUF6470 family protein [Syntrophomonadaceae bacterium]|nr:DUF6470 family protein [Syntrophomonadaceae bacterium]